MKTELEEAAEQFEYTNGIYGFKQGAKWQMERMKAKEVESLIVKQLLDETTPEELNKIDKQMSKQTAVNWLIEQISSSKYFYNLMEEIQSRSTIAEPNGILHKAKEMEKEDIMDAWKLGNLSTYLGKSTTAEKYYNNNFKH